MEKSNKNEWDDYQNLLLTHLVAAEHGFWTLGLWRLKTKVFLFSETGSGLAFVDCLFIVLKLNRWVLKVTFGLLVTQYVEFYLNSKKWKEIPSHERVPKAKLLLLKLIHLFAREVLLIKKLEIEEAIQLLKLI